MSGHTPGNTWGGNGWGVAESEDGPGARPIFCVGIDGVGHLPIAWVYRKADATLIATAPDMLAFISGIAEQPLSGDEAGPDADLDRIIRKARALISKATSTP